MLCGRLSWVLVRTSIETEGGTATCRSMMVTMGANVIAAQDAEVASAPSLKPMFVVLQFGTMSALVVVVG